MSSRAKDMARSWKKLWSAISEIDDVIEAGEVYDDFGIAVWRHMEPGLREAQNAIKGALSLFESDGMLSPKGKAIVESWEQMKREAAKAKGVK